MKNKAFFFDRDNTLIKDKGYTFLEKDLVFLPGVIKALNYLKKKDYFIIIITNQSGIARNYFTLKDVKHFHKFMNIKLRKFNAEIDDFFICGCHPKFLKPKEKCDCRKPKNLMLLNAKKKWSLHEKNIIMIGDKRSDKISAKKTNITFFYKDKKKNLYKQVKEILKNE